MPANMPEDLEFKAMTCIYIENVDDHSFPDPNTSGNTALGLIGKLDRSSQYRYSFY